MKERESFLKELEEVRLTEFTTNTNPCNIPSSEMPKEPVMGIRQAPLFEKNAFWPLVSTESPIVSYKRKDGKFTQGTGTYGRQFMALRKRYVNNQYTGDVYHGAIDLYAKENDLVIAIADGEIIKFIYFYLGTYAIFVKHKNVLVIYGEVSRDSLVFSGLSKEIPQKGKHFNLKNSIKVKAGQVIGRVIRNTSYKRTAMLHVEIFNKIYFRKVPWGVGESNPHKGLYDPSLALVTLARCGQRASKNSSSQEFSQTVFNEFTNLERKYRLNKEFAAKLGWDKNRNRILTLLGHNSNDLSDEKFVEAVSKWQKSQGLKPADGIIGPNTWQLMKRALEGATNQPQTVDKSTPPEDIIVIPASYKGVRGVGTKGSRPFRPFYRDEKDAILGAVIDIEGSYDTVNMYDIGILSWGISQWTLHKGSLQKALFFIKTELLKQNKIELWKKLFTDLDIVQENSNNYRIVYKGKILIREEDLRNIFRGHTDLTVFKKETIEYWAKLFTNAGRSETIMELQNRLGRAQMTDAFERKVSGLHDGSKKFGPNYNYRVIDYLGDRLKAKTLYYGMYVQNPVGIYIHFKRAIDKNVKDYGRYDIEKWPPNWHMRFENVFQDILLNSKFAYWGKDKANAAGRRCRTEELIKGYEKYKKLFGL